MQNRDNSDTKRDNTDKLGKEGKDQELSGRTAPKSADRESEMTPPENEVTVNLEPDELHQGEGDLEVVDADDKD
ncbi:hypothetical protein [Pontibacter harenae]|uniref:hypothetical protein n=1 Tax=Pontibacter harenae TaxID=2894083 RepID=UPI001E58323C|nr:hypothetical protein [Pontibacter harenae]MCC9166051.1 hypothetical protein [Pontibacter harenae]